MNGFFLTIEGVEGAGKSTLACLLKDELVALGREVVVTAEPGGDIVGARIRELLLDPKCVITDRTELLLFEAARAQNVETVIRPALERGAVVICDRYIDSSVAYQGYGRGIPIETVSLLNAYATGGLTPDLTILLDLPPELGLARQKKVDRVSAENSYFHEAVRRGFLAAAEAEKERFVVIDATLPQEEVLRRAVRELERLEGGR